MEAGEPAIRDYAFLSNCRTAALVVRGSIDWLCLPRFDGPSIFAALLDRERGGSFSISPVGAATTTRAYEPQTNVLTTQFHLADGHVALTDCLAASGADSASTASVLIRRLRCTSGSVDVDLTCDPRPDYGRSQPTLRQQPGRWWFESAAAALVLDVRASLEAAPRGGVSGRLHLAAGDELYVTLQEATADATRAPNGRELLEQTLAFWREWSGRLKYNGPYRDAVLRSALTLHGLRFQPSGAIVAAATTSLPEWPGAERNWDYRYCWLRDSTLTLYALEELGYHDTAAGYQRWLMAAAAGDERAPRIAYAVDGRDVPAESSLDHLSGFAGSRPVRIGNDARSQTQLDIFGEILDVAFFGAKHGIALHDRYWTFLCELAEGVCARWREPDHGIWEMRSEPRHFVYSKVLCWVCLNRAARLASMRQEVQRAARWTRVMNTIRDEVLSHGYNARRGAFVQSYGTSSLDASSLAFPVLGFIDARDHRMASTIRRTEEELVAGGLVQRYKGVDDGLAGPEGALLLCAFWLVDALTLLGEPERARHYFEHVLRCTNDVGLLSEEVDPSNGALLGNFPQAFSHLGLVTSAINLSRGRGNRRHRGPDPGRAGNGSISRAP